jgi:hypothetical protein
MPEFDAERLAIATRVRDELAIENRLSRPQARAFVRCLQSTWQVQTIRWSDADSARQLADARRLLHAAHIYATVEGAAPSGAVDCYRRVGEILEWLARADDALRTIVPIELLAAAAYQLGGLPAMASGLLEQVTSEHPGVALYGAYLRADFDRVIFLASRFWRRHGELTSPAAGLSLASAVLEEDEAEQDDGRVAWYFTVELVRSLGLLADCIRRGDDDRLERALSKLEALDAMAARTFSEDASLLVSLIRDVTARYVGASIYKPIRALGRSNEARQPRLLAYARDQFRRGRGILWASQLHGLERLLREDSFALCTPTGSGKTLVANLAVLKELLLRDREEGPGPLALYIVPSRALANEVEGKLTAELGRDMIITGLYGGADWGITDYWLTSEEPVVLIATVEKAEALFRYLGSLLMSRLRLLVIDEAHQVVTEADDQTRVSFSDHNNRSIRLESLISRVIARRPDVVRIALTAVAGGAAIPVARWVEGRRDAEPVGVRYRSTRQVVGVLETAPNSQGRVLLDIMNGRPLYLRDEEEPVYLPLRMPAMPQLPAAMRTSLYRFNELFVLWTALHLAEEDQRILISVAQEPEQTMNWYRQALELPAWAGAVRFEPPEDGDDRRLYDETRAACADYCGDQSFEAFLLERGIATSHGQMPQRLRRLMTDLIDKRICPITIATATLTEGVNLPFDLIFLTSLKRTSWDPVDEQRVVTPMTTSEFRNLAGRAGRPGAAKGLEGLTLVAVPQQISSTAAGDRNLQQRQMRGLATDYDRLREALLIEERDADAVTSPLGLLLDRIKERAAALLGVDENAFLAWLEATAPTTVSPAAGTGAVGPRARLADAMDELDAFLLTSLEELGQDEDAAPTTASVEAQLIALWHRTFTSVAAIQEAWLERAFVKRGIGIVTTLYPDAAERSRLYHYGLPPVIGRRFEAIVPQIRALLDGTLDYGGWDRGQRADVFKAIGALLVGERGYGFRVRPTVGDQAILENWEDVLDWWLGIPDAAAPAADQLRAWQRFVNDNLEFRLGVAIGAVVAQAWANGAGDPLAVPSLADWKVTTGLPWFAFWARELLRWGTHDPFIAFAMSQGLADTREAAADRRAEFDEWLESEIDAPSSEDSIDPQRFLGWQASLVPAERSIAPRLPMAAELTGTDGRKGKYHVIPVQSPRITRWFDPAGFELAVTRPRDREPVTRHRDDYELRIERGQASVIRLRTTV